MSANLLVASLLLADSTPVSAQPDPLTPDALAAALAPTPQGADGERRPTASREWFGGSERLIPATSAPKVEGLQVAWVGRKLQAT